MCLAIPARVIELMADDQARIELGGVHKVVSTALLEQVAVDDYVIVHVGYAIGKIDPAEVQQTLKLLQEMGRDADLANPEAYR